MFRKSSIRSSFFQWIFNLIISFLTTIYNNLCFLNDWNCIYETIWSMGINSALNTPDFPFLFNKFYLKMSSKWAMESYLLLPWARESRCSILLWIRVRGTDLLIFKYDADEALTIIISFIYIIYQSLFYVYCFLSHNIGGGVEIPRILYSVSLLVYCPIIIWRV